jgi:hypothetical protein
VLGEFISLAEAQSSQRREQVFTPLLVSLAFSLLCSVGVWYADRQLVRQGQHIRRIVSVVLIAISTATITLIVFANLFLGDGEPVSYHEALILFRMRVVATLLMIFGILIALIVLSSLAQLILSPDSGAKWQHFITPVFAVAIYLIAFWLVGVAKFFPVA